MDERMDGWISTLRINMDLQMAFEGIEAWMGGWMGGWVGFGEGEGESGGGEVYMIYMFINTFW